jgi:hypothetical protein
MELDQNEPIPAPRILTRVEQATAHAPVVERGAHNVAQSARRGYKNDPLALRSGLVLWRARPTI